MKAQVKKMSSLPVVVPFLSWFFWIGGLNESKKQNNGLVKWKRKVVWKTLSVLEGWGKGWIKTLG